MNNRIQYIIAIAFHPVVINTIALLLMFMLVPPLASLPYKSKSIIISLIFSCTVIIPALSVAILKLTNVIKSIELKDVKERFWPFLITVFSYFFCFKLLSKVGINLFVINYIFGSSLIVFAMLVTSMFWKISAHMASMGALVGLLVILNNLLQIDLRYIIALSIIIAGLVASARGFANAHNNLQLIAGFVLGFVCIYFVL